MNRQNLNRRVGLAGVLLCLLAASAGARRRSSDEGDDGFPDYNRLEYAKPLPPPDQQVQAPKPGSINMEVGREEPGPAAPVDAVPLPLTHKSHDADDSEPPLTGMLEETAPAVSTSSVLTQNGRK